ncbi:unnamed protein product, partial [Prorocentrum cordatum]
AAALSACLSRCPELRAARDEAGRSLLHLAAAAGAAGAVRALLGHGALLGGSAGPAACCGLAAFSGGHQEVFDLLVGHACQATLAERGGGPGRAGARRGGEEEAPAAKRRRPSPQGPYLGQALRYESGRLLDASGRGIMMGWEAPLMRRHACALLPSPGGAALNVGFGLGLVDGFLQERQPGSHAIIEPHPDVLQELERQGWPMRPGVAVHAGRWQDVVGELRAGSFDAVFYDTWQETYDDLLAFMREVPRLLRPGGRFSFFNGAAPHSIFEHAVFCRLAQQDLHALGLRCDFCPVELGPLGDDVWRGVRHRYWAFETYYLPLAASAAADALARPEPEGPEGSDASVWRRWPSGAVRVHDRVGAGVPLSEFGLEP